MVLRCWGTSIAHCIGVAVLRCCVRVRKQGYHSRKRLDSMFRLGICLQNLCVVPAIFTHTSRTHARVHALSNTSEIEDNLSRLNLMRSPKSCRPTYKGQWKCHPRKVLQLGFLLSRLKNMGLLYTRAPFGMHCVYGVDGAHSNYLLGVSVTNNSPLNML